MKVILTARTKDRIYCTVTIDGGDYTIPHQGISREGVIEKASAVQRVLLESFTLVQWESVYTNKELGIGIKK